jgi:hypothetical protein
VASIRSRATKKGESHTVTWRDPEAGLKSRTFDDKQKAQELKDFLDSNGNSFKLAAKAKVRKDSTSADRRRGRRDHINLLRKPQPGTVSKYRSYLANHIAPSDLGKTPVDRVDREAVILWMDGLVAQSRANQPTGQPSRARPRRTSTRWSPTRSRRPSPPSEDGRQPGPRPRRSRHRGSRRGHGLPVRG